MAGGSEIGVWCLLTTATITDLAKGKIYNALTFPFLLGGLVYQLGDGGFSALGAAALAVLVAFVIFFPIYLFRALAAADVKLLMAYGAWTDVPSVVRLALFAVLIGALVGAFIMLRRSGTRASLSSLHAHLKSAADRVSHRMPFAPAFLCAFFLLKIAERYRWNI